MIDRLSGVVLAGGASRRMGRDKATLTLQGKSFLLLQVEKLKALGIRDIMLSGSRLAPLPGTRRVEDEIPGKGPLSGLHACLKAAKHPACLVLSVDVPLVEVKTLDRLRLAHPEPEPGRRNVTALAHGSRVEPLIALYDCSLAEEAERMLRRGEYALRGLERVATWRQMVHQGAEERVLNCNTPEDLELLRKLAESI